MRNPGFGVRVRVGVRVGIGGLNMTPKRFPDVAHGEAKARSKGEATNRKSDLTQRRRARRVLASHPTWQD